MNNHTQYLGFAGVDLAKKVMQIHFVTEDGEITDKSAKRAEFLDFFRNRGKCLIGMEACGSSQDWARRLEAMGHEVHLMSPKAVKPFVSGQKNDHNDAIGIYKAMFNGVRRVPVKSTEIRDLQTLRRIRSQVAKDKIKEINHVRGLLAEYGIVMGKSVAAFNKGISSALVSLKERGDVSPLVAEELRTTVESIKTKIERQKRLDREIEQLARGCKNYENFLKTPGVGPFTAAMLCVLLCDPAIFANGRQFAAYIGLAPRSRGSGGKNFIIGIPSKFNCDSESRAVFVECAQALARYKNKSPWVDGILRRKPKKVAVIAIANKLARQVWAMANKGESFKQMTILTA